MGVCTELRKVWDKGGYGRREYMFNGECAIWKRSGLQL